MFDQEFSSDPNKNDDTKQAQSGQESMTQNSASGDDVSSHSSASQSGTSQSDVSGRSAGVWQGSSSGQNGAAGQSGSYSRGTGAWQGGASGQGGSYGQSTGWQNGTYGQNAGTWQNSAAGQNTSYGQNSAAGQNTSYGQNSAAGQNASYGQNSTYGQNAGAWQNGASGQSGTDRYGSGWQHGNAGQNAAQGTASQGSNGAYSGQNAYRGQNAWQSYQGNYQYGNGNGDYGTVPGKKKKEKKQKEKKPGRPMNPFWKKALAVVLSAACFGVIAGVSFLAVASLGGYQNSVASATAPAVSESQSTDAGADTQSDDSGNSASVSQGTTSMVVTDVTEVVDQVMPAIVAITNESVTSIESFWGQTYEQQQESAGSGIIIGKNDDELLIVTNNHVVKDANQLYVSFIDNSIVEAQVKGTSPSMDLAVVAVKLNNIESDTMNAITIATLGDSDSLKVGEPVIAIGNALGYGQSVTTGVVSALNRVLEVDETGTSNAMIQTDAAINPGNSGGALLDINGQVIGINSNKIGGNAIEGMGYAIPISAAQPIIEQLMNQETREALDDTQKGYLGISCINVTSAMAEAYGMPEGIYVAQVYPGTGAAEAGIVKGDIITGVNGMTVTTQDDLLNAMQYYAIGETIEITVMHGNPTEGYAEETRTVTLTSQEMMNSAQQ